MIGGQSDRGTSATAIPGEAMDLSDEECAICTIPLPLDRGQIHYKECCGTVICCGCLIAQKRTLIIGTNVKQPIKGSKEEEDEFMTILLTKRTCVCPFCNQPEPTNAKEHVKRLWKRIDDHNDPRAMNVLGKFYVEGTHGVSKNLTRAEELYQRSYDLGSPSAAQLLYELYYHHRPDSERNVLSAMQYLEEGARRGVVISIYTLACYLKQIDCTEEATPFHLTAACAGHDDALDFLMNAVRAGVLSYAGFLTKDKIATMLRAHQAAHAAVTSEPRDYARRYSELQDTKESTGELRTAAAVAAATAASASNTCVRSHGSDSDHFLDGVAYEDILVDYISALNAEKFVNDHPEYFVDLNFAQYLFSLCTSWYLKTNQTSYEMKALLHAAMTIKYFYIPHHCSGGGPGPNVGKLDRYLHVICNNDVRGVINMLSRETKPYCNCMQDKKTEADNMEKVATCTGCGRTSQRTGMKKCTACEWALFCTEDCYGVHWPAHHETCQIMKKNRRAFLELQKDENL